jgi:hypothetical protein
MGSNYFLLNMKTISFQSIGKFLSAKPKHPSSSLAKSGSEPIRIAARTPGNDEHNRTFHRHQATPRRTYMAIAAGTLCGAFRFFGASALGVLGAFRLETARTVCLGALKAASRGWGRLHLRNARRRALRRWGRSALFRRRRPFIVVDPYRSSSKMHATSKTSYVK